MVRSFTVVLIAALTLLSAPEVHAGRRHDGHRCRRDAQCLSGTCCNRRCSSQSASCDERAGLAAAAGQAKPPAGEKCTGNGTYCGKCGVCRKGRCTGGDNGNCGACQVCSPDGSACSAVPDGSAAASEYYGCGPDHGVGGLSCCGGDCVDISLDINNCGACGNACTDGKSCHEIAIGVWGCTCRDWETECKGGCADLQRDPNNCGRCGRVCPSGDCANGVCYCGGTFGDTCGPCETCNKDANQCEPTTCGGGQACCGSGCVDTQTDPNNCGACGNTCGAGQMCCGGGCVDTATDSNNCGSCGNVCLGGDTCQNGLCIGSACPAPQWRSCGTIGATTYCELQGTKCCIGAREATGCGDGTKCAANLDAYCCPVDYTICGIWAGYPCVPPGSPCPE